LIEFSYMDPIVYDNTCLRAHSLSRQCASTLNTVSERDYPGHNYFNQSIECLDMDSYERSQANGSEDNTVDAVIGISNYRNNRIINPRLLLVELRMGYSSTKNLSKTQFERKVTHTRDLLGSECSINPNSVFVFNNNFAPQAKHWLSARQQEGGKIRQCIACSTKWFNENVRSPESMSDEHIHTKISIVCNLSCHVENANFSQLFDNLDYWLLKSEKYMYSNRFEYEHVKNIIKEFWIEFRTKYHCLENEEDELNAQIMDEDIRTRLR